MRENHFYCEIQLLTYFYGNRISKLLLGKMFRCLALLNIYQKGRDEDYKNKDKIVAAVVEILMDRYCVTFYNAPRK